MFGLSIALVLAASPLAEATSHLKQGKFEELLFDFEGKALNAAENPKAAKLLAQAAQGALAAKDPFLALQLSQMALKRVPEQPEALGVSARAYQEQQEFAAAEAMADRWILAAPKVVEPRLFRAELAVDQADWQAALALVQSLQKPTAKESERAIAIQERASTEIAQGEQARAEFRRVEGSVKDAAAAARNAETKQLLALAEKGSARVTVYGADWCGPCRRTREYLTGARIPFDYVDVDRDTRGAVDATRLRREKGLGGGIPLIRIGDEARLGFDEKWLSSMLAVP